MTQKYETWEERQARLAKERAKRKREAEIEEALLMGYMLGNAGGATRMVAAEAAATGEF